MGGRIGGTGRLRGKRLVGAALLVGLWSMCLWGPPQAAAAPTYPFPDVPCIQAPFAQKGTVAQWCADYNWGTTPGSRASTISPYGYVYRNCTDYAAWTLASLGVPAQIYRGLGNAKNWASPPGAKGLRANATPDVHAVGVRTTGTYGHVAVVEAVHIPGYAPEAIRVSQYNKQGTGEWSTEVGTPAQLGLSVFVHFEDFQEEPVVLSSMLGQEADLPEQPELTSPEPTHLPLAPEPVPIAETPAVVTPEAVPQVVPELASEGEGEPSLTAQPYSEPAPKPTPAVPLLTASDTSPPEVKRAKEDESTSPRPAQQSGTMPEESHLSHLPLMSASSAAVPPSPPRVSVPEEPAVPARVAMAPPSSPAPPAQPVLPRQSLQPQPPLLTRSPTPVPQPAPLAGPTPRSLAAAQDVARHNPPRNPGASVPLRPYLPFIAFTFAFVACEFVLANRLNLRARIWRRQPGREHVPLSPAALQSAAIPVRLLTAPSCPREHT